MGNEKQKGKAFALLPIGVVGNLFWRGNLVLRIFYAVPAVVAFSDCFILLRFCRTVK